MNLRTILEYDQMNQNNKTKNKSEQEKYGKSYVCFLNKQTF